MSAERAKPQPDEDEIVCKFRKLSGSVPERLSGLALGIGDDAALLGEGTGKQVLTCDWFLEGTHFLREVHPADSVGWKCLARAVSDIAAMGGSPRVFLLSMAFPKEVAGQWLDGFLRGLDRASRRFGCALAGGDTTRSEKVVISVAAIGELRGERALLRSGARAGDIIYVSGALGGAEAGLRRLRAVGKGAKTGLRPTDSAIRKHLYPEPRVEVGQWLVARDIASAGMDVSDGLSTDLARLCAASGVGATIDGARIPIARGADRELALNGGDDYELLLTVPATRAKRVGKRIAGVPVTAIGEITASRKVLLRDGASVRELERGGWDPFAER